MDCLVMILVTMLAISQTKASVYGSYVNLRSTAPIGPDGRVLDTPEVAAAKAQHSAAQASERIKLADEAVKSGEVQQQRVLISQSLSQVSTSGILETSAPLGPDGRVVDTSEVAAAKAIHAAAQTNERIKLANEAARSASGVIIGTSLVPVRVSSPFGSLAVGPDGRVLETPEVAAARAAHEAAHINEKINLASEAARSEGASVLQFPAESLILTDGLVTSGAPIGPDGRVVDTAEVAVARAAHAAAHLNEKANLEAVRSADVLAAAESALAYGRLVY